MADIEADIIEATFALLAERRFDQLSVRAIADAAGVSLATLNQHFAGRLAIIEAFSRRIDQAVLSGDYSDMADENPRDRLFDVLMARLDALRPYRAALKNLMASARRDPALALQLNAVAYRSQTWMLAAAGVSATGWRGRLATQSLTVAFAQVLRVFLSEEDPGLPRTMAKLDGVLRDLQSRHDRLAKRFGTAVRLDDAPAEPTGWASAAPAGPEPFPAPEAFAAGPEAAAPFDEPAEQAAPAAPAPQGAPASQASRAGAKPSRAAAAKRPAAADNAAGRGAAPAARGAARAPKGKTGSADRAGSKSGKERDTDAPDRKPE